MVRRSWLVLLLVLPACAPDEPVGTANPPEADARAGDPLTRVITVAQDGTQAETRLTLTRAALAGRYTDYMGYGLDLQIDGSFNCSQGSCLGPVGWAAGTWEVGPDDITLRYTQADGVLAARPPDPLRVAALGPHYLLVRERDLGLFKSRGPAPYHFNLRQARAEGDIQDAYLRMIEHQAGAAERRAAPDRPGGQ